MDMSVRAEQQAIRAVCDDWCVSLEHLKTINLPNATILASTRHACEGQVQVNTKQDLMRCMRATNTLNTTESTMSKALHLHELRVVTKGTPFTWC